MNKDELPSEKKERQDREKKEREDAKAVEAARVRGFLTRTFQTEDGKLTLDWLRKQCLFGEPILGANPLNGEIDPNRTLYQAMRLNLYISIRKLLPPALLKEVEYEDF